MGQNRKSKTESRYSVVGKTAEGKRQKIIGDLPERTAQALAITLREFAPEANIVVRRCDGKSE
jgi:hypothetical protein